MKTTNLIFVILCLSLVTFESKASDIRINTTKKELIAPFGSNYTWYLNGDQIFNSNYQKFEPSKTGTYKVAYTNLAGERIINSISVAVTPQGISRIYVIGDSTVQTYRSSSYPLMGWGQVLQLHFDPTKYEVVNHAIGGRSSRSFHEEGRWTTVFDALQEGDFVFIQWGHNDSDSSKPERYTDTTQYKEYLRIYVNDTRSKGATPVLISPMVRNVWRSNTTLRNVFTEGRNDYRGAMLRVAEELDVLFVDLNMMSYELVQNVGSTYAAQFLFMSLQPGEYPNYPDGSGDGGTHFQEMGALNMAGLIADGIRDLADADASSLKDALLPTYPVNITSESTNPGLYTISGDYPSNANITMKSRTNRGFTFLGWADSADQIFDNQVLTIFTMEPMSYEYKAIFEDCQGIVGGSAYLDNCNTCIDSIIHTKPCASAITGDKACLWTGETFEETIDSHLYSFASVGTSEGDTITYVVRAFEDGTHELGIKYRNGEPNLMAQVYVNGIRQIESLEIPEASETDFGYVYFNTELTTERRYNNNNISLVLPPMENKLDIGVFSTYSEKVVQGTSCIEVPLIPLNINPDTHTFQVYPNPFYNVITLKVTEPTNYQILNLSGVIMESGSCMHKQCTIGEKLKDGLYILQTNRSSQLIIKR